MQEHKHTQGLKFQDVLKYVFKKSSCCHLWWRNINHACMFPCFLHYLKLNKEQSELWYVTLKIKSFLQKFHYNAIRWSKYAYHWKTQIHLSQNKNHAANKDQWSYQTQSANFLASTFKLPTLLPSWTNTAFGKVKPVRSSLESPWVNYNMWWWHSCVFWKQQGEVRVGHYKPLAFTTGCKRQWGQEASHRDQGAQSPAKNKQAPRVHICWKIS